MNSLFACIEDDHLNFRVYCLLMGITRVYLLMQPPSETVIPADSTPVDGTIDTQFKTGFAEDASLQVLLNLTFDYSS